MQDPGSGYFISEDGDLDSGSDESVAGWENHSRFCWVQIPPTFGRVRVAGGGVYEVAMAGEMKIRITLKGIKDGVIYTAWPFHFIRARDWNTILVGKDYLRKNNAMPDQALVQGMMLRQSLSAAKQFSQC